MLCDDTRVQQEQERLLFWQQLSQWKAKDSVYHPFSTPYFLFRLWNRLLPLLMKTCIWLARVAAPECDSLLTAEKLFFFSVEISSSLSVFFSQWSTADHEYPTFTHAIPLPRMSFLTCLKRVPTQFSFLPTLFSKMQFKYYLLQSRVITISGVLLVLRSYFLYLNH